MIINIICTCYLLEKCSYFTINMIIRNCFNQILIDKTSFS